MPQSTRTFEPLPNNCAQCNCRRGLNNSSLLCQCSFNETCDPLSSSRDPIWVDEFPGTNESAVRGRSRVQSFWENSGRRTAAAYRWVVNRYFSDRELCDKYTNRSFLCGSILLILGTYLFISPGDYWQNSRVVFTMFSVGGIFIWIPVFYWMSERNEEISREQQVSQGHVTTMDVPPSYEETLSGRPPGLPKEEPPPYDQVFPNFESNLIPHSSDAAALIVPVCSIHQPALASHPTLRESRDVPTLHRSRSLGDMN